MVKKTCIGVGALLFFCFAAGWSLAADKVLKMSTTTSTESSGLLDLLLPEFKKDTGIDVKVIAKGTGAAIRDGQDGNVDIIFVHARDREEKFANFPNRDRELKSSRCPTLPSATASYKYPSDIALLAKNPTNSITARITLVACYMA